MQSALTFLPGITNDIAIGGAGVSACTIRQNQITEFENDSASFFIYPNPFSETTELQFNVAKQIDVLIHITDVSGRTTKYYPNNIASAGTQNMQMNLNEFESGVYFCKVKMNDKTQTIKLIKQ